MFGIVKGCDVFTASKRKIAKEGFTSRLSAAADPEYIRAQSLAALESKGVVYGLRNKQKECVCLYVFKKEKEEDGKGSRLVLTDRFCAEGYDKEEAEFVKVIKGEIQEQILFGVVTSLEWDGKNLTAEDLTEEIEDTISSNFLMYLGLALIFYLLFDSVFMGLVFGALALMSLAREYPDKVKKKGKE